MASEQKKTLRRPGRLNTIDAQRKRAEQQLQALAEAERQKALKQPRALADDDADEYEDTKSNMTMDQVIVEAARMRDILTRFAGTNSKLPFCEKNGYCGWFVLDSLSLEHINEKTGLMLRFRGRVRTNRDGGGQHFRERVWLFNSLTDIPDWLGGCLWPDFEKWVPTLLPPGEVERQQVKAGAESMKDIKLRIMGMVNHYHKREGTMTFNKNAITGIQEGTWTTSTTAHEFLLGRDSKNMKVFVFGPVPGSVGGVFNMLPKMYETWQESTVKPRKQEDDDDVPQINPNELAKFVDYHLDNNGMWRCTHCELRWPQATFYTDPRHKCFPPGYVPRHSLVPNNDPRNRQMARFGVRSHSTYGTPAIDLDLNPRRAQGPYVYNEKSGKYERVDEDSKMQDVDDSEFI
jgi:hypothetical protein